MSFHLSREQAFNNQNIATTTAVYSDWVTTKCYDVDLLYKVAVLPSSSVVRIRVEGRNEDVDPVASLLTIKVGSQQDLAAMSNISCRAKNMRVRAQAASLTATPIVIHAQFVKAELV